MSDPHSSDPAPDDAVRHHVYDGIQEYNKRLPNWWLLTLYGTIAFSIGYWFYFAQSGVPVPDGVRVEQQIARIEAAKLAASSAVDDESLWQMSRNPVFASAGRETFATTCASCHGADLTGGIGPNLVDREWIHGSKPTEVYKTVSDGVLVKGMPAWGPVLGNRKITEVVAYIMSLQEQQG